ncbi:MAG: hypothetical protein AAF721_18125 [Myxococcota bacterium]
MNPYRATEAPTRFTLLPEERDTVASAARWMVLAGVVGTLAVLLELRPIVGALVVGEGAAGPGLTLVGLAAKALPGVLSALTLIAGLALGRIRKTTPEGDYRSIAESLRWLHVVFKVKGIVILIVCSLFALAFALPLLFAVF